MLERVVGATAIQILVTDKIEIWLSSVPVGGIAVNYAHVLNSFRLSESYSSQRISLM